MDIQEIVRSVQERVSNLEDVQLTVEDILTTAEDIKDRAVRTLEALQEDIELLGRIETNLYEAVNIEEDANNLI